MNVEVLISCMYQEDKSIIKRTNIQSDVIVINQCDEEKVEKFTFKNKKSEECTALFISTRERGLSKSRNMAIKYASKELCLICDDDEYLEDNYVEVITKAFNNFSEDILLFKLNHPTRQFKNYPYKIGFLKVGSVGSWQIAFRRLSIVNNHILFNIKMGSGTGNGAGEENKFIMDCIKNKLSVLYVPFLVGSLIPSGESQWFHGFTEKFWVNRGWQAKMIYGKLWGYIYIWFSLFRKQEDNENSYWNKLKWLHEGFRLKR